MVPERISTNLGPEVKLLDHRMSVVRVSTLVPLPDYGPALRRWTRLPFLEFGPTF